MGGTSCITLSRAASRTPGSRVVITRAEPINASVRKDEAKVVDTVAPGDKKVRQLHSDRALCLYGTR
jgi:hypothetical protein